MGISRQRAYQIAAQPASRLGDLWAACSDEALVDNGEPWGLMTKHRFHEAWLKAEEQVDLSDSEWELERVFGDLGMVLAWHCAGLAWRRATAVRLQSENVSEELRQQAALIKPTLDRELARCGLEADDRALTLKECEVLTTEVVDKVCEEWMRRGGRFVQAAVIAMLMVLVNALEDRYDWTSAYSHDDQGLPTRTYEGVVGQSLFSSAYIQLHQTAAGRLPFVSLSWDDLDFVHILAQSIEDAAPEMKALREEARLREVHARELEKASSSLKEWQRLHPRPLISPYGVNPDEAEDWVCKWMLHMGAKGSATTQYVGDGGIDVVSERYIAQVKMYAGSVGIAALREFAGVAFLDKEGRRPLFFTTGRYPLSGPELADRAGMALFHFDLASGTVSGANELGAKYADCGFISAL